jgi:anti-anti-sigma factor
MSLTRNAKTGVLALGGEIDLGNVAFLDAQLSEFLEQGDLVIDCSELDFVDVGGCSLLHRLASAEPGRGRVDVRNPPPVLRRVMSLLSWAP